MRPEPTRPELAWREFVAARAATEPFASHWNAFGELSAAQPEHLPLRTWWPGGGSVLEDFARTHGCADADALHAWSCRERGEFWRAALAWTGLEVAGRVLATDAAGRARWLPDDRVDLVGLALGGDRERRAIVFGREGSAELETWSVGRLDDLARRIAAGLARQGLAAGDAVALCMPLTPECVAACLAIVGSGLACVSVAESLSESEIAKRVALAGAKLVITVDDTIRGGKRIPIAERVAVDAPVVRVGDETWRSWTSGGGATIGGEREPKRASHVLFSSGTTGDPKAIPWTQLTPFKCAVDAHLHLDVRRGDLVCWPTSMGWMMGPWLVYAALLNGAALALFEGAPTSTDFIEFTERAGVTVQGVVPSLVAAWLDREPRFAPRLRLFASTGEASNPRDYLWLASRTGYRAPVVEYCGGTEIGGAYLTGSLALPASPGAFAMPALGLDFVVLDDDGAEVPVGGFGEVFLEPPAIGLSQSLLHGDHDACYEAGCPRVADRGPLRRHGDLVRRLAGGMFRAEGRADDTMNLGGIKVSSAEIEAVLGTHERIVECAAVARRRHGRDELVVFVVGDAPEPRELDRLLRERLSPLFRVAEVRPIAALPRTPSNKVVRRALRDRLE